MARSLEDLREDLRFHLWPGERYLTIYGATGLLAGVMASPFEWQWRLAQHQYALLPNSRGVKLIPSKWVPPLAFAKSIAPGFIACTGLRFLAFGQFMHIRDTKRMMGTNNRPKWVDIGVSGGAAGLVETVVANRIANPLSGIPPTVQLVRHPAKLFLCFSTFGFLTTNVGMEAYVSENLKCAICAATAGGLGSGVAAAAEGLRGKPLWLNAVPRGVAVIGTVIYCQVTACKKLLGKYRNELAERE